MRVAIYARVSTLDKGQDPENQLRELRAWCANSGHSLCSARNRQILARAFDWRGCGERWFSSEVGSADSSSRACR
jgi:DNA invertase Pin-like site-specific DNA recombinase